jgi:hypothetical protein
MQVAETFAFPIPVDQLPPETQARLLQLLPSEEERAARCTTGNCPLHIIKPSSSDDTQVCA